MKRLAIVLFALSLMRLEACAQILPGTSATPLEPGESTKPLLLAQQTRQLEQSASMVAPAETLFAYRISMRSDESPDRRGSSLYGLSIVPFETPVELSPVDPEAWESATVGSTLTFRVERDVIVRGGVFNRKSTYADANSGDLIDARVIRIREGKLRTRNGRTEPRIKEVLVGKRIKLDLESSPGGHVPFSAFAKNLVIWPVKSVVAVGEFTFVAIFCTVGGGCEI